MSNGKRHGRGVFYNANGFPDEGEWRNGEDISENGGIFFFPEGGSIIVHMVGSHGSCQTPGLRQGIKSTTGLNKKLKPVVNVNGRPSIEEFLVSIGWFSTNADGNNEGGLRIE